VGYEAPRPAGVAPPHGHYLELVYDAQTKELTDWNLSAQPAAFARPSPSFGGSTSGLSHRGNQQGAVGRRTSRSSARPVLTAPISR
jgi:hypothetical protein